MFDAFYALIRDFDLSPVIEEFDYSIPVKDRIFRAQREFENGLRIIVEQHPGQEDPEFRAELPNGKTLRGPATTSALQSVIDKEA